MNQTRILMKDLIRDIGRFDSNPIWYDRAYSFTSSTGNRVRSSDGSDRNEFRLLFIEFFASNVDFSVFRYRFTLSHTRRQ